MKSARRGAIFLLLPVLSCLTTAAGIAGQSSHGVNRSGGFSASQTKSNGSAGNTSQWSADPERGWVRDDDRHRSNEQHISNRQFDQNKAKQKGKRNKS